MSRAPHTAAAAHVLRSRSETEVQPGFGRGVVDTPIDPLALQRGEEVLGHCVVVRVADGAPRQPEPELFAAILERQRRIMTPWFEW